MPPIERWQHFHRVESAAYKLVAQRFLVVFDQLFVYIGARRTGSILATAPSIYRICVNSSQETKPVNTYLFVVLVTQLYVCITYIIYQFIIVIIFTVLVS